MITRTIFRTMANPGGWGRAGHRPDEVGLVREPPVIRSLWARCARPQPPRESFETGFSNYRRTSALRHGLSLVEVAISTLLVGIVLVAALRTVGSATVSQLANGHRAQALLIAHELANEILDQQYSDPTVTGSLGVDASESISGSRENFDDVDDYHNWTASPPVRSNADTLPASQNWTESVAVDYVEPNDLSAQSVTDQGIKRVRIEIAEGSQTLATLVFYVTDNSIRNRADD